MRREAIILIILLGSVVFQLVYGLKISTKQGEPSLFFVEKSYEVRYSDPVSLSARLLDSQGLPVNGITVSFYLVVGPSETLLLGTAETNTSGIAEITVVINERPGLYRVNATCTYEGYDLVTSADLTVDKELTKIVINQNITVQYTDNATITAWVLTDDNEPIANVPLDMTLFVGSMILQFDSVSDQNGKAVFTVPTKSPTPIVVGEYDFVVSFDGNDYYEGSSFKTTMSVVEETLIVQVSTIGKMVVGASIVLLVQVQDDDGNPVSFAEVRIFIDGDIVGVGKTNNQGIYQFSWTPSSVGNHTIFVKAMKEYYTNASYRLPVIIEGEQSGGGTPSIFIAILIFLIIAVVIAYISRR